MGRRGIAFDEGANNGKNTAMTYKRRKSVINAFDGTVEYVTPSEGKYAVPRDLRHRHAKKSLMGEGIVVGSFGPAPTQSGRTVHNNALAAISQPTTVQSSLGSPRSIMRSPPPSPIATTATARGLSNFDEHDGRDGVHTTGIVEFV
eukprot:SAG31_NODE_2397_length_5784_cov_5.338962_2_plen_146_part_00